MPTRQTVRGRRSCLLYLARLAFLLVILAVVLGVATFAVLPERQRRQQAESQLARARATIAAQATAGLEADGPRATAQVQATALLRTQATVAAQEASLQQAQATAQALHEALNTAQVTMEAQVNRLEEAERELRAYATDIARVQAVSTVEADAYHTALTAWHWPVLIAEHFNFNWSGWCTGATSNDLMTGQRTVSGTYRWEARALDSFAWGCPARLEPMTDFLVTVQAQRLSGSERAQYGLRLRADGTDSYYLFRVREDGYFHFALKHQDQWRTLIDWTRSPAIHSGEPNRLDVVAQGSRFLFYINGRLVGQANDDSLTAGQIGLMIQLDEPGDEVTVEFDDFEVRAP